MICDFVITDESEDPRDEENSISSQNDREVSEGNYIINYHSYILLVSKYCCAIFLLFLYFSQPLNKNEKILVIITVRCSVLAHRGRRSEYRSSSGRISTRDSFPIYCIPWRLIFKYGEGNAHVNKFQNLFI